MLKNYIRYRMADQNIDDITGLMERSGVSRNAITKLFRNENVDTLKVGTLMRICDALECNLSDLLEYKPEK